MYFFTLLTILIQTQAIAHAEPNTDICDNLWEYVCDSGYAPRKIERKTNPVFLLYDKLMAKWQNDLGLVAKLEEKILKTGSPFLNPDRLKTLDSVKATFHAGGKGGLYRSIQKYFYPPADFATTGLAYSVSYSLNDVLRTRQNARLQQIADEMSQRPGGMRSSDIKRQVDAAFLEMTSAEFLSMTENLMLEVYKENMVDPIADLKAFETELLDLVLAKLGIEQKKQIFQQEYNAVLTGLAAIAPKKVSFEDLDDFPALRSSSLGCPDVEWSCTNGIIAELVSRHAGYSWGYYGTSISMGLGWLNEPRSRVFSVLAHEVGHHLQRAGILEETDDLFTCLYDPTSRRPKPYQMNETISDLVAAELLAWRIESQPSLTTGQKRQMVFEGAVYFCRKFEDEHLWSDMRTNRIFMAHPTIRSALGCPSTPHSPRYCALFGSP